MTPMDAIWLVLVKTLPLPAPDDTEQWVRLLESPEQVFNLYGFRFMTSCLPTLISVSYIFS